MMDDDHLILSRARNELTEALKALLKAEIMDAADFIKSREHALISARAWSMAVISWFPAGKTGRDDGSRKSETVL